MHEWGKKKALLNNIWVILESDYKSLDGFVIPIMKEKITDNILRKQLNQLKTFKLYN